jgi:hypothetical protein
MLSRCELFDPSPESPVDSLLPERHIVRLVHKLIIEL